MIRTVATDGEVFVRLVTQRMGRSKVPFALEILEADYLDENYNVSGKDGNEIRNNELVAMGRPKEINDQKRKALEARNTPIVKEQQSRELSLRSPEELNARNKKIFHMGGTNGKS